MARRKNVVPSVEKTVCIRRTLVNRVDLELMSEVDGQVPFQAWKNYIEDLIRKDLEKRYKARGISDSVDSEVETAKEV